MKQIITILMALILSCNWASAQSIGGKVFYDQIGTIDFAYSYSSLPMGFRITTQLSADDFLIPEGGQTLIGCVLTYSTNLATALNVKIYKDNAGWPGEEIASMVISAWESEQIDYGQFSLKGMFTNELVLAEGKYWISAAATDKSAYWFFNTDENVVGDPTRIMTLSDFYSNVAIENPVWEDSPNDFKNLSFALLRTPDNNDLELISTDAPVSGNLSNNETVSISIKNAGLLPQIAFEVMYQVTSTINSVETSIAKVTETISGISLDANATYSYDFIEKVDLSTVGSTYSISTKVTLANEQYISDNEAYTTVKNYGPLVTMGVDKEITTCSAVFVDDGGVNNNYSEAIFDTITFYPETIGGRISLDFTFIDIWNSEINTWTFYDGTSTDAPILYQYNSILGNLPTYIQARNADGAMTVVLKAGSFLNGRNAGWEANVNCVIPNEIDFTALEMIVGNPKGFNVINNVVDIMYVVSNAGIDTISRNAYLVVDNVLIDTLTTTNLIPGVLDTLHFNWVPKTISDNVAIKVFIEKDGQDTNLDNELSDNVSVFAEGVLLESFETGLNLPLEWISTNGTSFIDDDVRWNGATHGSNNLKIKGVDTVIMPLMQAGLIDVLRFDAEPSGFGEQNAIQVLASKSLQGPWDTVGIAVQYEEMAYEMDLSDFTDAAYYFSFTNLGANNWSHSKIDYVRGAKLKKYDVDLMAKNVLSNEYIKTGAHSIFTMNIKNIGTNDMAGSNYKVEIKTKDSVYFSLNGIDILKGEEVTINAPITFATVDTLSIYYELVVNNELRVDNNVSDISLVIVSDKYITTNETIDSNSDVIATNRLSSVSEIIYYPSDIRTYGNLAGIEFTYEYDYTEGVDTIPAVFYIATIADSLLVDTVGSSSDVYWTPSWIETDSIEFTKVYDGMLDIKPGTGNSLFIPFDAPFAYNGSENLILLIQKDSLAIGSKYLYIDMAASEHYRYAYGYNNDSQINTDSIVTNWDGSIKNSKVPNIKWHFDNVGAPKFVSTPNTVAYEFADYSYNIEAEFEGPKPYTIEAVSIPDWMTFTKLTDKTATLTATSIARVGTFTVELKVSDGTYFAIQKFEIESYSVPVFTTQPVKILETGISYSYEIAVDYNGEEVVEFNGQTLPSWLTLVDNQDNTATLTGSTLQVGAHNVVILAQGKGASTTQEFTINVDVIPTFAQMNDAIIKEETAYSAEIKVNYLGANALTIVVGENHNNAIDITDNGNGTAAVTGTDLPIGDYVIHLITSNGNFSSELTYKVTVGAVPQFTSTPVSTGSTQEVYNYDATIDYNGSNTVMLSADFPEWLTFIDNGDGTAKLTGTPSEDGIYSVSILATGDYFYSTQTFAIEVLTVGINDLNDTEIGIFPNPASNFVNIHSEKSISNISIINAVGYTIENISGSGNNMNIDISKYQTGYYLISIETEGNLTIHPLVIKK
ncbi:MAG: T9SS type A sorting domain-containing protein [Salinivirgaceae bacterium]|nr:T9SS type A sorting domain-containing protein [Salinivirgaceae bacterium]